MSGHWLHRFTPVVARRRLWMTAGIVWSCVGLWLCILAGWWFSGLDPLWGGAGAIFGLVAGGFVYRYGMSRLARKNIHRIEMRPEKTCFFAFQAWKSYILIGVMITAGHFLRHSPQVPVLLLAVVYETMGIGLLFGGRLYFRQPIRSVQE